MNLVAQPPCCQDGYGMLCKFCSCPDRTARIIIHQGDLLRSRWWASHPASLYKHQEAPRIPAFVVLGTKTCRLLAIQVEQLDTSSNIAPLSYVFQGPSQPAYFQKNLHSFSMRRQTPCSFAVCPAPSRASFPIHILQFAEKFRGHFLAHRRICLSKLLLKCLYQFFPHQAFSGRIRPALPG